MYLPIVKSLQLISRWDSDKCIAVPCQYDMVPGGRLNKKDGLTRYGDSHVKDKTS